MSQAGLLAQNIAHRRCSLQWRDRAGFTPASLFSPLRGTRTLTNYKDRRLRTRHTNTRVLLCQIRLYLGLCSLCFVLSRQHRV